MPGSGFQASSKVGRVEDEDRQKNPSVRTGGRYCLGSGGVYRRRAVGVREKLPTEPLAISLLIADRPVSL